MTAGGVTDAVHPMLDDRERHGGGGRAIKSLLPLVIGLCLLLSGCVTVRHDGPEERDLPEPSARSVVGGVETWDLTDGPSAESVGLTDGSRSRIYETDEPRTIELLLPGGPSVRFEARLLTFRSLPETDGDAFTFGVRGATVDPVELDTQLRDLLEQLGAPTDVVDTFSADVAAAPADQTERIRLSSPTTTFGDLALGVGANLAPIAGSGRYTLGGSWNWGRPPVRGQQGCWGPLLRVPAWPTTVRSSMSAPAFRGT